MNFTKSELIINPAGLIQNPHYSSAKYVESVEFLDLLGTAAPLFSAPDFALVIDMLAIISTKVPLLLGRGI